MPGYRSNLDSAFEADELLGLAAGMARSPGTLFTCGRYVLEAVAGREPGGILLACGADAPGFAIELAARSALEPLALKGTPGAFHLAPGRHGGRAITVVPLEGGGIEAHLERSAFTVEAMAVDLASGPPREITDPLKGLDDLDGGTLRCVSPGVFVEDPARLLLAAELAFSYGLELDGHTEAAMKAAAARVGEVPPARAWRLLSSLFGGKDLSAKARMLARTGALGALFPEVEALYGVPQNYYHHLGVWEHTLEVLDHLERMLAAPASFFPAFADRVAVRLAQEVEGSVDRRSFLGFAALVHDVGKPGAMSVETSGRIRCVGHQVGGARLAGGIAGRIGLGRKGTAHLVGVVGEHMRLGFLLKEGESARTRLQAVRELGRRTIEVVMLSLADRMATRGEASTEEALQRFKRMSSRVLSDYFWDIDYPPLVDGRDVMMHAGMSPGPELGRALLEARVAQREATVSGRQQALEYLAPDFKGRMGS
jgi:Probable RNA and SrmB- binding site of polymerase A